MSFKISEFLESMSSCDAKKLLSEIDDAKKKAAEATIEARRERLRRESLSTFVNSPVVKRRRDGEVENLRDGVLIRKETGYETVITPVMVENEVTGLKEQLLTKRGKPVFVKKTRLKHGFTGVIQNKDGSVGMSRESKRYVYARGVGKHGVPRGRKEMEERGMVVVEEKITGNESVKELAKKLRYRHEDDLRGIERARADAEGHKKMEASPWRYKKESTALPLVKLDMGAISRKKATEGWVSWTTLVDGADIFCEHCNDPKPSRKWEMRREVSYKWDEETKKWLVNYEFALATKCLECGHELWEGAEENDWKIRKMLKTGASGGITLEVMTKKGKKK